jgi:hypothetical protein
MSGLSSAAGWAKGVAQSAVAQIQSLTVEKGANSAAGDWDSKQRDSLWSKLQKLIGKVRETENANGRRKGGGKFSKNFPPDFLSHTHTLAPLFFFFEQDIVSMISLPVWVFEPISFLHVMGVPLEFAEIFDKAAEAEDPALRLGYVAAFMCGTYCDAVRPKKPFNPILGETFELLPTHGRFRFLCEQVSHHPPISVGKVTSASGAWWAMLETHLKSKFYGNSSEFIIEGTNHLDLPRTGDHITWGHMGTITHNLIIGGLWIDHHGTVTFTNHKTGDVAVLTFAKAGWMAAGMYVISGDVRDAKGVLLGKFGGKWNERMTFTHCNPATGEPLMDRPPVVLWERPVREFDAKWKFHPWISQELIALTPEQEATLPVTDSKLRTDRRLLEKGDLDAAGAEKHRLEEKQRAEERERKAKKVEWVPKWFKKVDDAKFEHVWQMDESYWTQREERIRAYKEKQAAPAPSEAPAPSSPEPAPAPEPASAPEPAEPSK